MLLSSLPEKRAKNSFINMIGSLPKKCLLGLVGTPGGEAGGARAGPRRGGARAPRDGRTPRGRRPDGLDVGSESAGRLSAGRRGLTTVVNVTQQNVSIPRTSFLQGKSWRLQSYSSTTTRNRTLENSLTGHERQESHPNTPFPQKLQTVPQIAPPGGTPPEGALYCERSAWKFTCRFHANRAANYTAASRAGQFGPQSSPKVPGSSVMLFGSSIPLRIRRAWKRRLSSVADVSFV